MTAALVNPYPASLEEVIKDVKYKRETLVALRRFKSSNPWKGTFPVRLGKFIQLHNDLCLSLIHI